MKKILITGGAGFIGAHLARELVTHGYAVRALDNLSPQVHGAGAREERRRPSYLDDAVELQVGDVRDPDAVRRALDGVDAVYHLAAIVGVGQSMYQIAEYTSVNNLGTAVLLEEMVKRRSLTRLVVASSMSVYGEGYFTDAGGRLVSGVERTMEQLAGSQWEMRGEDGGTLTPIPTGEDKTPSLASVYALSKYDQERLCLVTMRAYGRSAVALRLFNTYGLDQALSNPYTGVLAIFASRLVNGKPPLINEDGLQRRDFVSVRDVARAFVLALEVPGADGQVFNIGSGRVYSVLDVARLMAEMVSGGRIKPEVTGKYRMGDIRHCFPDISRAEKLLGYRPEVTLEAGLSELCDWLRGQVAVDRVEEARAELAARGLAL
ncbi:MAG: NAD-dependent epimerase/dehydratase [Myxococcales bacterium]|nr:NAD-dependent epimerase/dehydratase [Myxococcales bacterium]